jgi:hypothetical protein
MTEPTHRDVAEQERCVLYSEIEKLTKERDDWQHKADVAGACLLHVEVERDEARSEVARLRAIEAAAKAWADCWARDWGEMWPNYTDDPCVGEVVDAILAGKGPGKEEK